MNKTPNNENRNYGLDLCRILAMLGIATLHILGQGGLLSVSVGSTKYWLAWFIEIIAYGSVNVFGMLSGYLGVSKKRFSSFRLIELLFTMFFYSIIITIVFFIFDRTIFTGIKDIIYAVFPFIKGRYWYIISYILVFLLMPYLNSLINNLNNKQCKNLFVSLFVALSVIPSLITIDLFKTEFGYSSLWLLVLYLFGAIYKKIDKTILCKWTWPIIFLCNFLVLFMKVAFYYILNVESTYMIAYTSPLMVMSSIFIIQAFAKSNLNIKLKKFTILCSLSAFDVYILHSHILIFDNIIYDNFKWINALPIITLPFTVLGSAIAIYCIGVFAYIIRTNLFKVLKIDVLLKCISKPFDKLFFKGFDIQEKD